jgi:hypothetical protein
VNHYRHLVVGLTAILSACASTEAPPAKGPPVSHSSPPRADGPTFQRPYKQDSSNFLYNLLFCDDLALFRPKDSEPLTGPFAVLLSSAPRAEDIERIANDQKEESRLRILAFNYLRSKNIPVPARQILGVVVEVPLDGGLDTLAAFVDGRVRYINHSEKMAIFEATPAVMKNDVEDLLRASAAVVAKIGPWDKPRRPPPVAGNVRLTFLVSDGLYFGEGPFSAIQQDPIGGPVLLASSKLLEKIVSAAAD